MEKSLPKRSFRVVEYPGIVKNPEKALKTLGGLDAIDEAFGKETLGHMQLNYRPEDEFSHPINGEVVNTSNLVLCVTRKIHKASGIVESTTAEIVGVAEKTARFRSMALICCRLTALCSHR